MPIYTYKSTGAGCNYCREGFDELQSMKAPALTVCPQCGGEVKRIPAPVRGNVNRLSNSNLRDHGFTKLENRGDGTFEKMT